MNINTSLFDIIGPIMIGPSSSHTAGAVRLGQMAAQIYKSKFNEVKFTLYNSYAQTSIGHGTEFGLLGGVLGLGPDNCEIKNSKLIAKNKGIEFIFEKKNDSQRHPNSVDIKLSGDYGCIISGNSLGGGLIEIINIDGFDVKLDGNYNTIFMVYKDYKGVISHVSGLICEQDLNIASLNCDRSAKGENAIMTICIDGPLKPQIIKSIGKIPDVYKVRGVEKI